MTAAQPPAPPVPPLYCPLPSAIHPDAAAIAQSSMDWLAALGLFEREGLRDRMVRTHAAEWASRIAPFGERRRLQIVSDWTHLGFAIDDCRFDAGPLVDQPADLIPSMMGLMPHLDHPEAPTGDDLFARGLRDLSVRARACAPAAVVRNWVEGNMEWFFAVACLTSYRAAGTMPSLAAYVDLGPRDRAMKLTGSLIELAEGTFLPHDERESPPVRAVTQAANLLVTIGNDLFSFAKEAEHGVLESNIVGVIGHEDGCEPEQAVRKAVALHDQIMCRYLTLRRRIGSTAGEELLCHLSQLDHLIRGNLEWSLRVPRYRHPAGSRPPGPPFARTPSDTTATAPPIPAIAWWWDEPEPPPSFAIEVLPEWPRPRTSRLIKDAHRCQPAP
jgi:Terpene synthase family 2, C-terminal metal binding